MVARFLEPFIYALLFVWMIVATIRRKSGGGEGNFPISLLVVAIIFLPFTLASCNGERKASTTSRARYDDDYEYTERYMQDDLERSYMRGYDAGEENGKEIGRDDGYSFGYDDGYDDGYSEGFEAGWRQAIAEYEIDE